MIDLQEVEVEQVEEVEEEVVFGNEIKLTHEFYDADGDPIKVM